MRVRRRSLIVGNDVVHVLRDNSVTHRELAFFTSIDRVLVDGLVLSSVTIRYRRAVLITVCHERRRETTVLTARKAREGLQYAVRRRVVRLRLSLGIVVCYFTPCYLLIGSLHSVSDCLFSLKRHPRFLLRRPYENRRQYARIIPRLPRRLRFLLVLCTQRALIMARHDNRILQR